MGRYRRYEKETERNGRTVPGTDPVLCEKKERDGGCEGISGASWKPGQGNEDLPCGRDQRKGLCVRLSVLGLKRGRALLRSLYLAPSFGYPGTVSDPGGDGLTEAFDQAFETVYGAAGQWTAQGKPHPTYFEFLFYMGMVLFSRAGMEVLVLETGMGGLYDVTNVVEHPLVSVITSVSIDHTAFLGHTAGEIAVHKAGIIKPGCPAVYDDSSPEAEAVILETAEKKGSPAFPVGCVPFRLEGETLVFQWDYLGKTEEFTVGFPAPYQAENAALAVTALSVSGLGIPAEAVRRGLRSARWPARMERLLPGVYLDGAHNEDGIRAFLEAACLLKRERRPETTRLLFAVAADKEYGRMLEEIGRSLQPDECYLTAADTSRALSVDGLFQAARERMPETARIRCFETTKKAFEALLADRTGRDLSFIAGSLYLAGEIRTAAAAWMEEER